jgi:hypothetical protein
MQGSPRVGVEWTARSSTSRVTHSEAPWVIVSDHTAWYSEESVAELQTTVAQEAVRVCTGSLPLSLANPEVLHRLGRFAEWTPSDNARWQIKRLEQGRAGQATGPARASP